VAGTESPRARIAVGQRKYSNPLPNKNERRSQLRSVSRMLPGVIRSTLVVSFCLRQPILHRPHGDLRAGRESENARRPIEGSLRIVHSGWSQCQIKVQSAVKLRLGYQS
jgi:hypothetical protein